MLEGVLADGATTASSTWSATAPTTGWRRTTTPCCAIVSQRAPSWSPRFVDDLIADRVFLEVQNFAWAVQDRPRAPVAQGVDTFLGEFAADLQRDPETIERVERIKFQVVEHPDVQRFIGQAWKTVKTLVLDAAEDPSSALRTAGARRPARAGRAAATDAELRDKIDGWLVEAAGYVVRHYRREITTLITDTVARWDAEETSRKVELQVGRDLQFIRINGTVVGALAGLVIYTVSQLFFAGRSARGSRCLQLLARAAYGRDRESSAASGTSAATSAPSGSTRRCRCASSPAPPGSATPTSARSSAGCARRRPRSSSRSPAACGSPPRPSTSAPGSWRSGRPAPSSTRSSPTPHLSERHKQVAARRLPVVPAGRDRRSPRARSTVHDVTASE